MTTTTHHPGRCERGSIQSLRCPVCAPYYRAELARLQAADQARVAKYGSESCPHCGQVYRVDEQGNVEDHAGVCRPLTDDQIWG